MSSTAAAQKQPFTSTIRRAAPGMSILDVTGASTLAIRAGTDE